ncbi:SDR family NAD(P)-dependent oxidoreductase [Microbacterium sp. NPDC055910]|uniref:SDR family NAD(P)-dependent oxidoreductase n=1 Tax=Microbacterium sp. NPDC055910 TaxID=3345659 RepID=UPI0035D95F86
MKRLDGRIALITAAGSGMGRAGALRFGSEGAHVLVTDLDEQAAQAVADEIIAAGGTATARRLDVSDVSAIQDTFTWIENEFGILHVLYNHAGIPGAPGLEVTPEQYEKAMDINLRSAFFATQYATPLLRKAAPKASIIFTSSTSGQVGSPFSPLYSLAKGGITVFMKAVAKRLGPEGIRSNAILPAMIETPMLSEFFGREAGADIEAVKNDFARNVPLGRAGSPDEVAAAAAFLASDDASWITGTALPLDGGLLA